MELLAPTLARSSGATLEISSGIPGQQPDREGGLRLETSGEAPSLTVGLLPSRRINMSSVVQVQTRPRPRSVLVWFAPVQAAVVFSVIAVTSGGQTLKTWLLGALTWVMALPLLVSLEAGLVAMMLFEPLRGVIRRAQYLFVEYSSQDPIHVLTPIVTLLAFAMLLKSQRLAILRATPLAGAVSVLGIIYFIEIFNPLQGGLFVGLSGAMFVLVPLLWFYFGQSVTDQFITNALRLIVVLGLVASLYGVYQLVFGYPSFEQYWISNTEFYESIAVGHVQRALATFSSAEEWGRYTEVGAIAAFGFAAGARRIGIRASWMLGGAALSGSVLLTGQRTAVFGLLLGVVVLIMLGARNFRGVVSRVAILLLPVVLVAVFVKPPAEDEIWSKGDDETVGTLLLHTQRGLLKPADEESLQVRLGNWAHLATSVIPYRPLGAGIGAGNLGEVRFNPDYDLPPLDSSIVQIAISCGIPGLLLFVWILSRSTWFSLQAARRSQRADRSAELRRTIAAIMFALVLNSVFGLTFTLYSVAPVAWLLIGWISAESMAARREAEREAEREIITI